jgi:CheY-like chemotaxis protein
VSPQRPILIVDDEPANLALMQNVVSQDYQLVFAATGMDALAAAQKHKPSMALSTTSSSPSHRQSPRRAYMAHGSR